MKYESNAPGAKQRRVLHQPLRSGPGRCLRQPIQRPQPACRQDCQGKRHIAEIDILRSYVGLLCLGKSDYQAIAAMREDDYFKQALGIGEVNGRCPRTAIDFIQEFPSRFGEMEEWQKKKEKGKLCKLDSRKPSECRVRRK